MLGDFREGLRQLLRSPGYTTTALVTLALGIGATTAIFTLVHQVMLKSLPVTKPEELWVIGDKIRCCNWGGYTQGDDGDFALFSWEMYRYFRANTPELVDLAALQAGNQPLGVRREGSRAAADTRNGEYVSGNFFRTFGVQPWSGRLLNDTDDQEGAPPVAVMSYRVWQEKYAADRSVVGATYSFNGHPFVIVGIAAPGFFGAKMSGWGMPDFWLPVTKEPLFNGASPRIKRPDSNFLDLVGRAKPGGNPRALEAKLKVELHDWLASHVSDMQPGEKQLWQQQTLHIAPGGAGVTMMRDDYEKGLRLLLAAAACVLLVACGNLANLMLARGLKNRTQTSIRVALGASRGRLVRKAMVECVTLSVIGGVLGIAVAYAGARIILNLAFQLNKPNAYVPVDATPSWPVLLFALAISIAAGLLFGVAPAWMTSRVDPADALRSSNRSVRGGSSWAQKALVIAQTGMSLVLLSAAALLGQSLRNLEHQNFGFATAGRYVAMINPTLGTLKPEQMLPLYRRIDERLLQIPGIRMTAAALYAPMTGDSWNEGVRVFGRPEPGAREDTGAGWARVMPGFFEALGSALARGRTFSDRDTETTRPVAVVNEAFAKRFFKNQNPIGQHFGMNRIEYSGMYEIVGVVKDVRYMTWAMRQPVRPMFWLPETQSVKYDNPIFQAGESFSHFLYNIVLWAPGNVPNIEGQVRKALASIDPDIVLYSVDPYSEIVGSDFQQQKTIATLTTMFGALGLILAAIGLYGVMAYSVEQRTSEIGIRMALGAPRVRVLGMVLGNAFVQIGIGLAIGIPCAVAAGRLMKEQLYSVTPSDPSLLILATSLLAAAAFVAALVPSLRASAIEPMTALRNE